MFYDNVEVFAGDYLVVNNGSQWLYSYMLLAHASWITLSMKCNEELSNGQWA